MNKFRVMDFVLSSSIRSMSTFFHIIHPVIDNITRIIFFLSTGKFTSKIYSENCLFEDPTIKFYGRPSLCQYLIDVLDESAISLLLLGLMFCQKTLKT